MVRGIALRSATGHTALALDDPRFADGWWAAERDRAVIWRWTDGNAALPAWPDSAVVEVWVGASLRYPAADVSPGRARAAA